MRTDAGPGTFLGPLCDEPWRHMTDDLDREWHLEPGAGWVSCTPEENDHA